MSDKSSRQVSRRDMLLGATAVTVTAAALSTSI
jgi:hypothetical protein